MGDVVTMVTVGPESGDLKGADSGALQEAADRVAVLTPAGGGVLVIKAGA